MITTGLCHWILHFDLCLLSTLFAVVSFQNMFFIESAMKFNKNKAGPLLAWVRVSSSFLLFNVTQIRDIVSHRYLVCWERLSVSSIRCLQWPLLFWQMNTMFPEKHVWDIVPMRDGIRLLKICFKLWVVILRLLDGKYGNTFRTSTNPVYFWQMHYLLL